MVEAVGVAEVAVEVVSPEVAVQLVCVHVASVAELTERMPAVGPVVRISLLSVTRQFRPTVAPPLSRVNLQK